MTETTKPENPWDDIETVLRHVRYRLEEGRDAELGSEEALLALQHAIWGMAGFFEEHIQAAFPRENTDPAFQADAERAMEIFTLAPGFLGEMAMELRLALAGLQIGDVRNSVQPRSRRGGVTTLERAFFKSIIVGAADRVKARGGGDAAYRCDLKKLGLNSRTVEDYRRQIARTPSTNLPAKFINDEQMKSFVAWALDCLKIK